MLTEAHGKNGCLLGRSYHLPLPSTLMSLWGIFQPSFSYFYFLSSIPFIHFPLRHKGVFVTVIFLAWQNKKKKTLDSLKSAGDGRREEVGGGREDYGKFAPLEHRKEASLCWLCDLISLCSSHYSRGLSAQELFFWVSSELHHVPWCCACASHWTKNLFTQRVTVKCWKKLYD